MKPFNKFTANETVFGIIYFLLQLLIIPSIIVVANELLLNNVLSEAEANTICFGINFIAVLVIFHKYLRKDFLFAISAPWNVLRWAGVGFLVYMAGNAIVSIFITAIDPAFANINDASIMEMVQDNYGMMTVSTVILVPIAEECFYRVLIFRNLYDRSPVLAYLVSMVIFSLAHVVGYIGQETFGTLVLCFIQYLPAAFALAWAYRHSGSIFASVLIHMTVNQIGMLAMR